MKLAVVADVHGNLTALDAVIADLDRVRPDLVVHGGDLVFNGPRPAECLDRIRALHWPGVLGNTDEAVARRAEEPAVAWAVETLGEERLDWLRRLPLSWRQADRIALVHAIPGDLNRIVWPEADDAELQAIYGPLGAAVAVYCHIHRAYIRRLGELTVANTGSVGLPDDGDPRASYLLIEDGHCSHRRVPYDVERAVTELQNSRLPAAIDVAVQYRTGRRLGR